MRKTLPEKIDRVDILLDHAGIAEISFTLTVDVIETVFGTNHN